MNISLSQYLEDESPQEQITEHQDILRNAGYPPVGPAVLIPEPGPDYPGSYQVWSPVIHPVDNVPCWVYINPEGVMVEVDFLPEAGDMEDKS